MIFDFCQNLEYFSQNLEGADGALAEPLGQRLFKARLELLGVLDKWLSGDGFHVAEKLAGNVVLTEDRIRQDTAEGLHSVVCGMSLDNFVVRPKRLWVERWAEADTWTHPGNEQLQEAADHLSNLPSAVRDDDEDAKRFDLLMLRAQLASLRAEPGFDWLKKQVRQMADALLELNSIPAVREQLLLIEAIAGDEWWEGVTLPMLEQARRKLRALIKLLETTKRKVVYTDFEDELGELSAVELTTATSAGDFERFRQKARVPSCARTKTAWRCTSCAATSRSHQPTWANSTGCCTTPAAATATSPAPANCTRACPPLFARWWGSTVRRPSRPSATSWPAARPRPARSSSSTR